MILKEEKINMVVKEKYVYKVPIVKINNIKNLKVLTDTLAKTSCKKNPIRRTSP